MAEEQRGGSSWAWTFLPSVVVVLVLADGMASAWSLVTAEPWSWRRFGTFLGPALAGAVGSSVGQELVRRGVIQGRPGVRRRLEGAADTSNALRTGVLPASADPDEWRARVRRRLRTGVTIALICTASCVVAATLTAMTAHLNNGDDPALWTMATVVLLLGLAPVWQLRRLRRRARRLLPRL